MEEDEPVSLPEECLDEYMKDEVASKKSTKDTIVTTVPGMGSIVYKRIGSGEIVASIVRDKDEDTSNNMTFGSKKSAMPTLKRKLKSKSTDLLEDDVSEEGEGLKGKRKKKILSGDRASCPINERNVENILDRTLLVTESLQHLLNSFKDELKRAGGGPTFGRELKPTGLKKRVEISKKMTKAYINYQQAIDNIGELGRGEDDGADDDFEDDDFEEGDDDYYDDGFKKELEQDDREADADLLVRSHTTLTDKKRGQKKSETPRNYPIPSRFSECEDSNRTWREDMVTSKENKYWYVKDNFVSEEFSYGTNVSDDLWMSCEPGSDDDTIYNVGFPKGSAKK